MVQVAAHEAGLEICTQTPLTVPVPGGTSGVLYGLSPSCDAPNPATTVRILVVGFSSTEATNAAILQAQVAVKNGIPVNTAGFYSGFNLILVQGSATNTADVEEISTSLLGQGAGRIF